MVESRKIKGSTFGGFNRKDVVRYIEKLSEERKEIKQACERLEAENSRLNEIIKDSAEKLQGKQPEELLAENERLMKSLSEAEEREKELSRLLAEKEEALGAFSDMRLKLTELEFAAAKRAAEIEKDAKDYSAQLYAKSEALIKVMRKEYGDVRSDIETTAAHLQGELVKMGDNLSLMTDILDKTEDKFSDLDQTMQKMK